MSKPIAGGEAEWDVRTCRPALQDFHLILPRYYDRSVLSRQLLKLRWWNPNESMVIDLSWNPVAGTDLFELFIEQEGGIPNLRVVFFKHSTSLWVLGGLGADEPFGERQQQLYSGRAVIVKERAD